MAKKVEFEKITLDVPFEKVLELDQSGARIAFDDDPERFLKLKTSQVNQLSELTRRAYEIAMSVYEEKKAELDREPEVAAGEPDEQEVIARIQAGANKGIANRRTEIWDKRQGYETKWIRPDQTRAYEERGFFPLGQGPEKSRANPTGKGAHKIMKDGKVELIAYGRKQSIAEVEKKVREETKRKRREGIEDAHRSAIEKAGFRSFGDEQKGTFGPLKSDE